jgi:hypothetical protein
MRRFKRALWIFDVGFERMNQQDWAGWMPIAGIVAGTMVCLMMAHLIGARWAWAWAIPVFSGLNFLIARRLAAQSLRRVYRFGVYGPLRARWWIELAAVNLLLVFCLGLFAASNGAGAALPPWQKAVADVAFQAARILGPPFVLLSLTGYIVGLAGNQRVTGRSLEMVNFHFWLLVGIVASSRLPPVADWIAPTVAIAGIVALILAGGMAAKQKWDAARRKAPFHGSTHVNGRPG